MNWSQLIDPDIATDPAKHRDAYLQVFRDAQIDQDLGRERIGPRTTGRPSAKA
jgi:hypothetical protein